MQCALWKHTWGDPFYSLPSNMGWNIKIWRAWGFKRTTIVEEKAGVFLAGWESNGIFRKKINAWFSVLCCLVRLSGNLKLYKYLRLVFGVGLTYFSAWLGWISAWISCKISKEPHWLCPYSRCRVPQSFKLPLPS